MVYIQGLELIICSFSGNTTNATFSIVFGQKEIIYRRYSVEIIFDAAKAAKNTKC